MKQLIICLLNFSDSGLQSTTLVNEDIILGGKGFDKESCIFYIAFLVLYNVELRQAKGLQSFELPLT